MLGSTLLLHLDEFELDVKTRTGCCGCSGCPTSKVVLVAFNVVPLGLCFGSVKSRCVSVPVPGSNVELQSIQSICFGLSPACTKLPDVHVHASSLQSSVTRLFNIPHCGFFSTSFHTKVVKGIENGWLNECSLPPFHCTMSLSLFMYCAARLYQTESVFISVDASIQPFQVHVP